MKLRKFAVGTFVAFGMASMMILGVAAPANAATIGGAWKLWDYMLTLTGTQLMAAQGPAAVANWTAQNARNAALSANTFRAGQVYGTIAAEAIAEVIPLTDPLDVGYGLGRQIPVAPGASGPRVPFTGLKNFMSVTPRAVGAATVALTAFMLRADIASTGLSWFGMDAQGLVCENDVTSGGFVNFVTGQDCELYEHSQAMIANEGVVPGMSGGWSCKTATPDQCIRLTKQGNTYQSGSSLAFQYCWEYTGILHTTSTPITITSQGNSAPHSQLVVGSSNIGYPTACDLPRNRLLSAYSAHTAASANMLTYVIGGGSTPVTPTTTASDPDRWLECTILGSDGITRSANTPNFKESAGAFPEPNCPVLPAGVTPDRILVTEKGDGRNLVIYDESASPEFTEYQEEFGELCAANSCFLDLIHLPSGLSCFGMEDQCDGWLSDPDRDTKYQCNYGGVNQPVQECFAYANTFSTQKRIAGNPYADPKTGEDLGGATGVRYDVDLMGRPVEDPAFARACGGVSQAINPLEWVLRPIQCGLSWAFVPRTSVVQSAFELAEAKYSTKMPAQLIGIFNGWQFVPPGGGCNGISIVLPLPGQTAPVQVANACPGTPLAQLAYWSRIAGNLSISALGIVAISRNVGRIFGFGGLGDGSGS